MILADFERVMLWGFWKIARFVPILTMGGMREH